jgi:hypothetical protein
VILSRQHDVWVACTLVLADKLALQFNQFGVVSALQRLIGGNGYGGNGLLKTGRDIGCAGQGRSKCADDGKADQVGQLPGTQGGCLVGLGTKTLGTVLNAKQSARPSQSHNPMNMNAVN